MPRRSSDEPLATFCWIQQIAAPFQWKFSRHDLHKLLAKTDTSQPTTLAA